MIASEIMRGFNDLIILNLLAKKDSYGYEIAKEITKHSQNRYIIKETTLYTALTRLLKNQLIQDYPGSQTNGKARTYYRITDLGQATLTEKLQEWEEIQNFINQILKGES